MKLASSNVNDAVRSGELNLFSDIKADCCKVNYSLCTHAIGLGTPEERGLARHDVMNTSSTIDKQAQYEIYGLPFGMEYMENASWTKHIPFLPTFIPKNERNMSSDDVMTSDEKQSDRENGFYQLDKKNNTDVEMTN